MVFYGSHGRLRSHDVGAGPMRKPRFEGERGVAQFRSLAGNAGRSTTAPLCWPFGPTNGWMAPFWS